MKRLVGLEKAEPAGVAARDLRAVVKELLDRNLWGRRRASRLARDGTALPSHKHINDQSQDRTDASADYLTPEQL
jgi:hypothetical protein